MRFGLGRQGEQKHRRAHETSQETHYPSAYHNLAETQKRLGLIRVGHSA